MNDAPQQNKTTTWKLQPPDGNEPHSARLRGGNVVSVVYTPRNQPDGRIRWSWVCQRTKRVVYPMEFEHA